MVLMYNTTEQTLQPGQAIVFDKIETVSGCGESARSGGPLGLNAADGAVYRIDAGGNITGATAAEPVELSIAIGGVARISTTRIYTPAVADAVGSIDTFTYVRTSPFLNNDITVINSGTNPVTVSPGFALASMRKG